MAWSLTALTWDPSFVPHELCDLITLVFLKRRLVDMWTPQGRRRSVWLLAPKQGLQWVAESRPPGLNRRNSGPVKSADGGRSGPHCELAQLPIRKEVMPLDG